MESAIGAAVASLIAAVVVASTAVALRQAARRRKWASAGGAVIDGHDRIALVRQRDRKGRWRWTFPKGRIEPGETAEEAALREVYEESGLRARIVRPIVFHEGRLHFTYFFEMVLERDDGVHDGETREVRLVPLLEAARLLESRRDLHVLRRLMEMRTRVVAGGA